MDITVKSSDGAIMNMEYIQLFQAYALGDKLLAPKFQNTVINAIFEKANTPRANGERYLPRLSVIQIAYNITLEGSLLRQFLADEWAEDSEAHWFRTQKTQDLPHAFLADLVDKLLGLRQDSNQPRKASKYHLPVTPQWGSSGESISSRFPVLNLIFERCLDVGDLFLSFALTARMIFHFLVFLDLHHFMRITSGYLCASRYTPKLRNASKTLNLFIWR